MTTRWTSRAIAPLLIAALAGFGVQAAAQNGSEKDAGTAAKTEAPKASAAPAPATGHEHHATTPRAKPKAGRESGTAMTIVGEVMDPACFLEAGPKSIGPGHYQCAIDCARSGQTLAIYDRENDRIYFIAGELPGKNPNDPLMAFIHKKVDVTGMVYHRAGAYGIVINKVALHQEKKSSAQR
ncbi:MAG TPA: hypothetical protein VFP58_07905 [Candidatus Eisenbacteria bacterium]|nr:hypothetical protein [Candidatus Eisenbacteria bacterium]